MASVVSVSKVHIISKVHHILRKNIFYLFNYLYHSVYIFNRIADDLSISSPSPCRDNNKTKNNY